MKTEKKIKIRKRREKDPFVSRPRCWPISFPTPSHVTRPSIYTALVPWRAGPPDQSRSTSHQPVTYGPKLSAQGEQECVCCLAGLWGRDVRYHSCTRVQGPLASLAGGPGSPKPSSQRSQAEFADCNQPCYQLKVVTTLGPGYKFRPVITSPISSVFRK
jgi:hypothetical protein